jgi:hypothetical protein
MYFLINFNRRAEGRPFELDLNTDDYPISEILVLVAK